MLIMALKSHICGVGIPFGGTHSIHRGGFWKREGGRAISYVYQGFELGHLRIEILFWQHTLDPQEKLLREKKEERSIASCSQDFEVSHMWGGVAFCEAHIGSAGENFWGKKRRKDPQLLCLRASKSHTYGER